MFSIGLSKSERNYSTYERELYSIVRACESFRVYLLRNPFTLRTDHKALVALFNTKLRDSARVVKWILRLQEYPFTVEYIAGKDNVVADALSRIPWPLKPVFTGVSSCPESVTLEMNAFCNDFSASDSDSQCEMIAPHVNELSVHEMPILPSKFGKMKRIVHETFPSSVSEELCLSRLFFPSSENRSVQ